MDMTGEYRIEAPRDRVWAALNDPDILRQCIPGCEEIEKVSDTEFTAKAKIKVGPVNARFTGRVTLSDMDAPNGYTISGEGQGGAAGFGKGGAKVALVEDGPDATILTYTAEAQVGGKLAQIGSRLIQGTAKKMADDFFACFTGLVGAAPADETEEDVDTAADTLATEVLVEVAEEVEAAPEVPSSGMPLFASVPLQVRPEAVVQLTEEAAPILASLAEPHHRIDDDDNDGRTVPATGAATAGSATLGEADTATGEPGAGIPADAKGLEEAERASGLRPMVWVPLLILVLFLLLMLFQ